MILARCLPVELHGILWFEKKCACVWPGIGKSLFQDVVKSPRQWFCAGNHSASSTALPTIQGLGLLNHSKSLRGPLNSQALHPLSPAILFSGESDAISLMPANVSQHLGYPRDSTAVNDLKCLSVVTSHTFLREDDGSGIFYARLSFSSEEIRRNCSESTSAGEFWGWGGGACIDFGMQFIWHVKFVVSPGICHLQCAFSVGVSLFHHEESGEEYFISASQIAKGFVRLSESLDNLSLDVVYAWINCRDVPNRETALHLVVWLQDPFSAEMFLAGGTD